MPLLYLNGLEEINSHFKDEVGFQSQKLEIEHFLNK